MCVGNSWINHELRFRREKKKQKRFIFEMSTPIKTKHPAFNTQQQLIIYIRAWNFRLIGIGLRKIYSKKNYITLSCHGHHRGDIESIYVICSFLSLANLNRTLKNMLKVNWFVLRFGSICGFDFDQIK